MNRLLVFCAIVILLSAQASLVQAKVVTITFDPNNLIDLYPAQAGDENIPGETKATQPDARRIHAMWGAPYYETFYNPPAPHTQPDDYNTYMNWRDGLTESDEGIACFNNWFLGYSTGASWGETCVAKTDAPVSATVSDGWNWREIREPYRVQEGACIQFWTTDPTKYIRNGGTELGNFSITVDLYEDTNGNGMWDADDLDVNIGDSIRFWLGCINGDDAPFYRDDTQGLYFDDEGWGGRTPAAAPFSATYANGANNPTATGFEAMLTSTAVPEPTVTVLMLLGAITLASAKWQTYRRR